MRNFYSWSTAQRVLWNQILSRRLPQLIRLLCAINFRKRDLLRFTDLSHNHLQLVNQRRVLGKRAILDDEGRLQQQKSI